MKSRETLIRLKRFQVDEKRRQVAQIEQMVAEFERMATDLDRELRDALGVAARVRILRVDRGGEAPQRVEVAGLEIVDEAAVLGVVAREQARIDLARSEANVEIEREELNALLGLTGEQTKWTAAGALAA